MLLLKSNQVASSLYIHYLKNIRNLETSARRLATGERLATIADGPGEIGVADRYRNKISSNDTLLTALTTAKGYVEVQGETLTTASEIIQDMITLSGDALNTTLNTTDRIALDAEFQALEEEFTSLMSRRFNGISLFGESLTIRVAIDTGETMTLSKLSLNLITFNGMTLSQLADASAAQISLESRASSLNLFIAKSGSKSNRIDRTTSFVESVSSNLQNTENKIRDIDLAIETGVFTQEQVILASAQSVIAQSNNLIQSILTFLS